MEVSTKLKERFCKDCNIPLRLYQEPYFMDRLKLYDKFYGTMDKYTADGDVIATYQGKIDIDTNDGGYVKFDYDGKRYIYYNCFVESIADIN